MFSIPHVLGTMETDLGCQRIKKWLFWITSVSEVHSRESCVSRSYLHAAQAYELIEIRDGFLKELLQRKTEIWERNLGSFVSAAKSCQSYVMDSVKRRMQWSEQQLTGMDGLAGTSRKKTWQVYKNPWSHCERKQTHMLVLEQTEGLV